MSIPNNASGSNPSSSFSLMNLVGKTIFDGSNFNDWIRNIRMALRYDDKEYILHKVLKEIDEQTTTLEPIEEYGVHERKMCHVL